MSTQSQPAIEETVISDATTDLENFKLQLEKLNYQEKFEFLSYRKQWSTYLLTLVIAIVAFNAMFLVTIGLGWLQFQDEWLVRIIFTGSFVEVLGLAKIVVDFLFKEPPKA
jgi:hypothetical protein